MHRSLHSLSFGCFAFVSAATVVSCSHPPPERHQSANQGAGSGTEGTNHVPEARAENDGGALHRRPVSPDFESIETSNATIGGYCHFVLHRNGDATFESTRPCGPDLGTFSWHFDEASLSTIRDRLAHTSIDDAAPRPPRIIDAPTSGMTVRYAADASVADFQFASLPEFGAFNVAIAQASAEVQRHPVRAIRVEVSDGTVASSGAVTATLSIRSVGTEPVRIGNPARPGGAERARVQILGAAVVAGGVPYSSAGTTVTIEHVPARRPDATEPHTLTLPPGARETFRIATRVDAPLPALVGVHVRLGPPTLSGGSGSLPVGEVEPPDVEARVGR